MLYIKTRIAVSKGTRYLYIRLKEPTAVVIASRFAGRYIQLVGNLPRDLSCT